MVFNVSEELCINQYSSVISTSMGDLTMKQSGIHILKAEIFPNRMSGSLLQWTQYS